MSATIKTVWQSWIIKARRIYSYITQTSPQGGLYRSGDWSCVYPDGRQSVYLTRTGAQSLRELHGGSLKWRFD